MSIQPTIHTSRSIPHYELFGELLAGRMPGPIHHETIQERSSKHNWTIRLHRHRRMAQVFLFNSPGVFFRLGDIEHTSTEAVVLVVPPGTPHGFRFANDVVGDVVSIRLDAMSTSLRDAIAAIAIEGESGTIFPIRQTASFDKVVELMSQLSIAYRSVSANKTDILALLLELILLYLSNDARERSKLRPIESGKRVARHDVRMETFCNLVEDQFRQPLSVDDYAGKIGISAPHLTRLCRAQLGSAPNELVRQRRMLEAKRLLEYTALPIFDIAQRCGFRDAAFFSRTFKQAFGLSPALYRRKLD